MHRPPTTGPPGVHVFTVCFCFHHHPTCRQLDASSAYLRLPQVYHRLSVHTFTVCPCFHHPTCSATKTTKTRAQEHLPSGKHFSFFSFFYLNSTNNCYRLNVNSTHRPPTTGPPPPTPPRCLRVHSPPPFPPPPDVSNHKNDKKNICPLDL